MREVLFVHRGIDHYVFSFFIRLKGIDGDRERIRRVVILQLDDGNLVGPDSRVVRYPDLDREGPAAGIDLFSGHVYRSGDHLVAETRQYDPDRRSHPDPLLVDLGNLHHYFQIIGIDETKLLAARGKGFAGFNADIVHYPADIGRHVREIELFLVDLHLVLRDIDLVLGIDEVDFGPD